MRLALLVVVTSACVGASAAGLGTAAVNTAIAGTVSAVRRAQGDCFTPCTPGTACNHTTGLCEPLPCEGRCAFDEQCQETPLGGRCVPSVQLPLPPR